jgi:hypothetical protein
MNRMGPHQQGKCPKQILCGGGEWKVWCSGNVKSVVGLGMVLQTTQPHSRLTLDWSVGGVGRRARIVDGDGSTKPVNIITNS